MNKTHCDNCSRPKRHPGREPFCESCLVAMLRRIRLGQSVEGALAEGAEAARAGAPAHSNPYSAVTDGALYEAWRDGFFPALAARNLMVRVIPTATASAGTGA